ncbi:MAG: hypothetical protein JSU70_10165 [Phycisphaerales bacterium]|nr:MAG: hypothetical protein JSU70_10165 [Phycisphaerales bacterium]
MSPISRTRGGKKMIVPNTLYTAVLAVAFGVILATAAFTAYKCYTQYGTIFSLP